MDPGYGFVSFQTAGDVSYYTFKNGGGYLHILWSKSNQYLRFSKLAGNAFAQMRAADYRENTIVTGAAPASASLTLTQDPVYLFSPAAIPLASLTFDAGPALAQRTTGYVSADCGKITGWACNAGDYARPVTVGIYDGDIADGKPVAFTDANTTTGNAAYDQTIAGACGGYGSRTFSVPTPLWLKATGKHTLTAYALNLDGSPPTKLNATPGATTFQCINNAPTARPGSPAAGTPAPHPTATRPPAPISSTPPLPIPPSR